MAALRIIVPVVLLALGACQNPSPDTYANRGDPERLLSMTSEIVYIDLASAGALDLLSETLAQDPPARAILNCPGDKSACRKAQRFLGKHQIATESTASGNNVALVYERVVARDCESRYVDNSSNPHNLHAPAFGCSIAGNTVQMVTDKRQFTNPALLGYRDAEKAVQAYENYSKPAATDSSSQGGGSGGGSIINSGSSSISK